MKIFFKLIRLSNLLIVILLQLVLYFGVLLPIFKMYEEESVFTKSMFFVFVLITALIAAGGNIINDIIDVDIDKVNKPEKWFVGNIISLKQAYHYYIGTILLGFIASLWIALSLGKPIYMLLYIGAVVLLYLYSKYLKGTFLLGNILVSAFSSGVIGVILIFEYRTGLALLSINSAPYIFIQQLFFGFMLFSFFTSFLREIVKDVQDVVGDKYGGAKTIPLVIGVEKTKWLLFVISAVILSLMIYWIDLSVNEFNDAAVYYMIYAVIPFHLYIIYLILKAKSKNEFDNLSKMIKILMLIGIGMLVFYLF